MTERSAGTVAVTGGSGKLGRAAVRELVQHGWRVINLDQNPSPDPICPFVRVDLSDFGQTLQALDGVDDRHRGLDAVVHLAAIPAPGMVPDSVVFTNNLTSTYNVFSASRRTGIRNIVTASSETVLGLPFDTPPPYIPVDEDYPARPESSYSLSKHLEETMAAQFCRWEPELKIIALRFSNVMEPNDYARFPAFNDDAHARKWNLWGYIDARDGAAAIRLALEHQATGFDTFVIANSDTVMSTPSAELAAAVFPGVEYRGTEHPGDTLLSIAKAQRVLGFAPQHNWHTTEGQH